MPFHRDQPRPFAFLQQIIVDVVDFFSAVHLIDAEIVIGHVGDGFFPGTNRRSYSR